MVIILKRQLATQLTIESIDYRTDIEPDFNRGRNSNKANFLRLIRVFRFSGKSTTLAHTFDFMLKTWGGEKDGT